MLIVDVSHWLTQYKPKHIVIALSGGMDSCVLLDVLAALSSKLDFSLRAIHVNHHLHHDAAQWAMHCQRICDDLNVELCIQDIQLEIKQGDSVEEKARDKRYEALFHSLNKNELLVTAHHQDDQAETFLLQLIRGAGPRGLSGMPACQIVEKGQLGRPLLNVDKETIKAYAKRNALKWIEDPSNQNTSFRRNFIRQRVLPELKTLSSSVSACIARSAEHCATTESVLNAYLDEELQLCMDKAINQLTLSPLRLLPALKQGYLIRRWLMKNQVALPSTKKLNDILNQAINAKSDSKLCVSWGGGEVRRYNDTLYLLKTSIAPFSLKIWDLRSSIQLGNRKWIASLIKGKGICSDTLSSASLTVRTRQGGERCKVAGHPHSRPLKKILQDWPLPPWERDTLPLFYADEELVGVGDLFICEGWQAQSSTPGWVLTSV